MSTETYHLALLTGKHTVLGWLRNISDRWDHSLLEEKEPEVIEKLCFSIPEGRLSVYRPWADEPASLSLSGGILTAERLKYGLIFRIDRESHTSQYVQTGDNHAFILHPSRAAHL